MVLAGVLGACSDLVDSDARRTCRSLIPALHPLGTQFRDIVSFDLPQSDPSTPVLTVQYRAHTPKAPVDHMGHLTCSFVATSGGKALRLVSLSTDRRSLGPVRLHLLQRFWIDSGLAARSDPAPISIAAWAPHIPHIAAIALQQAVAALPAIANYALLATAYSLIYGLLGRINLAFGDLASLAGYGAFLGFSMLGDGHLLAAVLVALVVGLATATTHGGALGQVILSRLAQAPGQHVLIATIGLSIVWQETMRLTQGSGNRWLPPLLNRPIAIARADDFIVTVTPIALVVVSITALIAGVVIYAMRTTRFGLAWRASADDPLAAAMLGINPHKTLVNTALLAAALSGLCGVLTTLYYGGVGYAGGLVVGLKALIAAIIGGIGSIPGAMIGGLLLGVAETAWSSAFQIEYRDPAIFIGLAVVLWLKPGGFFGDASHEHRNQR
jgi:branched-chain amino acid transport system permease protein